LAENTNIGGTCQKPILQFVIQEHYFDISITDVKSQIEAAVFHVMKEVYGQPHTPRRTYTQATFNGPSLALRIVFKTCIPGEFLEQLYRKVIDRIDDDFGLERWTSRFMMVGTGNLPWIPTKIGGIRSMDDIKDFSIRCDCEGASEAHKRAKNYFTGVVESDDDLEEEENSSNGEEIVPVLEVTLMENDVNQSATAQNLEQVRRIIKSLEGKVEDGFIDIKYVLKEFGAGEWSDIIANCIKLANPSSSGSNPSSSGSYQIESDAVICAWNKKYEERRLVVKVDTKEEVLAYEGTLGRLGFMAPKHLIVHTTRPPSGGGRGIPITTMYFIHKLLRSMGRKASIAVKHYINAKLDMAEEIESGNAAAVNAVNAHATHLQQPENQHVLSEVQKAALTIDGNKGKRKELSDGEDHVDSGLMVQVRRLKYDQSELEIARLQQENLKMKIESENKKVDHENKKVEHENKKIDMLVNILNTVNDKEIAMKILEKL